MGLPVVTQETGFAIQAELTEQRKQYDIDLFERLELNNPCLANFIAKFSACRPDAQLELAQMGLLVYRLLESQAEADEMKCDFHS